MRLYVVGLATVFIKGIFKVMAMAQARSGSPFRRKPIQDKAYRLRFSFDHIGHQLRQETKLVRHFYDNGSLIKSIYPILTSVYNGVKLAFCHLSFVKENSFHGNGIQEVAGSIPTTSTTEITASRHFASKLFSCLYPDKYPERSKQ